MNSNTFISAFGGVVFLVCQCVAESGREKTTDLVVEAQTVSEIARTMSRAQNYGIPICIEEGESSGHRVSFVLTNATIETVMRKIKSTITNCDWSFDEKANVVNIFPNDSMLGWTIEKIDIDAMSLEDVLLRSDPLRLQEHGITFFPGRGNLKWLKTPITLKAECLSAMQALNMICCQLPFKARWELRRSAHRDKKTGVLSIQGCY